MRASVTSGVPTNPVAMRYPPLAHQLGEAVARAPAQLGIGDEIEFECERVRGRRIATSCGPPGVTYSRDERGAAALGERAVLLGIRRRSPSSAAVSATCAATARGMRSPRCRSRPWPGRACRAARRVEPVAELDRARPQPVGRRHPAGRPRPSRACSRTGRAARRRRRSAHAAPMGTTVAASPHAASAAGPPKPGSAAGTTSGTLPSLRACSRARSRSHDVRNPSQS